MCRTHGRRATKNTFKDNQSAVGRRSKPAIGQELLPITAWPGSAPRLGAYRAAPGAAPCANGWR